MQVEKSVFINLDDIKAYILQASRYDIDRMKDGISTRLEIIDEVEALAKERQSLWDNKICPDCDKTNKECRCLPF